MNPIAWIAFVAQVMPAIIDDVKLVHELFVRHNGDAESAAEELKRIKAHRNRLDAGEAAVNEQLAELDK